MELTINDNILEDNIIYYTRINEQFLLKIMDYLTVPGGVNIYKSYFNQLNNQIILNVISWHYKTYGKLPSWKVIYQVVRRKLEPMDTEILLSIRNKILDLSRVKEPDFDYDFLEEETIKFIRKVKFYEVLTESQKDLEDHNFDAITKKIQKSIEITFDEDLGVSILNFDKIKNDMITLDKSKKIETGFDTLDEILEGGMRGSEIYCLSAVPGIGKTAVMGSIALNAFKKDKKVLVVTFETSSTRLFGRYLSNLLKMTSKDILLGLDDKTKEQTIRSEYDKKISNFSGDIIVKEYGANTANCNDIRAYMSRLKETKDWEPDLLIFDHLLIMATNDRKLSTENSYKYYKTVTEETRNIAKDFQIPILTATQINRHGQGDDGGSKARTTSKDMSESRGIYDTVDFFATLNQTAVQKTNGEMKIYVDKWRNGINNKEIDLKINYDYMDFKEKK